MVLLLRQLLRRAHLLRAVQAGAGREAHSPLAPWSASWPTTGAAAAAAAAAATTAGAATATGGGASRAQQRHASASAASPPPPAAAPPQYLFRPPSCTPLVLPGGGPFAGVGSRPAHAAAAAAAAHQHEQQQRQQAAAAPTLRRGLATTTAAAGAAAHAAPAPSPSPTAAPHHRPLNLCNAVNEALHIILDTDDTACVFGEDVAFGGVFRCTAGLGERFGRRRVFNTPLSEQGIAGFGIGLASEGVTALAELQFADYMFPAIDQLVNEAAKFRYRSGGEFSCGGLTVRAPYGAVGHGGHYHSQSPEAFFTQVPGLRVVVPSSPAEAKGLLIASARCPDPVIFLEPKALYRAAVEHVPEGDYELPLGKARRLLGAGAGAGGGEQQQQGPPEAEAEAADVTVVAWGAQAQVARAAADAALQAHGVRADVLDLRSLLPWDAEAVAASVQRTGRLVVTHEAPSTGGFGAEIAAEIARRCFLRLEAPPLRVCGQDTPFPLVLEPLYLPGVERVLEAIVQSARY